MRRNLTIILYIMMSVLLVCCSPLPLVSPTTTPFLPTVTPTLPSTQLPTKTQTPSPTTISTNTPIPATPTLTLTPDVNITLTTTMRFFPPTVTATMTNTLEPPKITDCTGNTALRGVIYRYLRYLDEDYWLDDCWDNAMTQPAMNECASQQAVQSETMLIALFDENEFQCRYTQAMWDELLAIQALWEEYKEKDCRWTAMYWEGGSIMPMQYALCISNHNVNRLRDLLVGIQTAIGYHP